MMKRTMHWTLPGLFFLFALAAAPALTASASAAQPATGIPVSMHDSVAASLAFNPELKAYQEGRQLSQHAVDRARAGYFPSLGLYGGAGTSRRNDVNTRSRDEDSVFRGIADADLRLIQPLFHGFDTTHGVARAKAELDSSDNLLEERGSAVVYAAISSHTDVVRRRELVAFAEENVREHVAILKTVRQRFNSGVATTGEVDQVLSRHSRAKATLASYTSALDAAMANYLRVTGNRAENLAAVAVPELNFANRDAVREGTLAGNPSLKSAQAVLSAAVEEKGQAGSRFYPQVDLVAGPSWSDRNSRTDQHTTDFSAELRFSWLLFNGGADTAAVNMVSAKIRQARQNLFALMNALNEEIDSTFSRYVSSEVESKEYNAAKNASRRARADYQRQFESGKRSLIDVLDAENDYFFAASQEVFSKSDRVLSAYRLMAISGVLLQNLGINPANLRVDHPTTKEVPVDNLIELGGPLNWKNAFE